MVERDFDQVKLPPEDSPVRVVGSLGMAEKLLHETGSLKPFNSWMALTPSKNTYPDALVTSFSKWASQNSQRFTLIIADGMQIFNKMAISDIDPRFLTEKQRSKYTREIADYKRSARKRRNELGELVTQKGLANVEIILWSELLCKLAEDDQGNKFIIDSFRDLFYNLGVDKRFDHDITDLTREKAAHILARAHGDAKTSEFAASFYAREQLVLTMTLATLAYYGYKIKIGPVTERSYDEIAMDILKSGFGTCRSKLEEHDESLPFGAVYLEKLTRWDADVYIREVENTPDVGFQEYQRAEMASLKNNITSPWTKTFIDVGAGYGRLIPHLAPIAKQVIGVELDENMAKMLCERTQQYSNVKAITGDANELSSLLKDTEASNPIIILAQNSLGTWKGDRNKILDEMRKVAEQRGGEIVISLLRQEALQDWGLSFYATLEGLAGKYNPGESDLGKGIFRTDRGYESHWFSKEEIEVMKQRLGGTVVNEALDYKFHIFHIAYPQIS